MVGLSDRKENPCGNGHYRIYVNYMISWDANKAIRNFEKHGVSFEEGATVFADENSLDWEDVAHSIVENRYKRLGQ